MDQIPVECRRGSRDRTGPRCRSQRRTRTIPENRLFQAIEETFEIGADDLCAATRGRSNVAFARQTGMYLARVTLGMTLAQAGLLFARDRTTAAHACRLVEDLRDDVQFDTLLDAMEAFVLYADLELGSRR
ncbi:MAG: helix-turn-helix domain-containing protein [Pseudomonadota bacterium]|jgi:chromosomal replication initiation ATPase DnaA